MNPADIYGKPAFHFADNLTLDDLPLPAGSG